MDGPGNSKIRQYFEVKTEKRRKFVLSTLLSLWERQKTTHCLISFEISRKFKKAYLFSQKRAPFFNVCHQTMHWFCHPFLSISSQVISNRNVKNRFINAFLQMKFPPKSRKKGICERLHLFVKNVPFFINFLLRQQDGKAYSFLSILLSLKKVDNGAQNKHTRQLKTLIRAPLAKLSDIKQTTEPIPFKWLSSLAKAGKTIPSFYFK